MFRVLIAGGGVAALEATLALRALAEERVSIEVIAPDRDFVYRPLSVAEPFRVAETRTFPLASLVEAAGGRLSSGRVTAVNPVERVVLTDEGGHHPYDAVLVALGASPHEAIDGALTFAGPGSGPALEAVLDDLLAGAVHRIAFAVPTGVTWPLPLYELALLTGSFAIDHCAENVEIVVVTPEDRPLALFGAEVTDAIAELLEARGIELRARTTAGSFQDGRLRVAPGGSIEAERVIALPRLEGPWVEGLPCDRHGFLPIDDYCRVGGEPDVFAAGDATQLPLKQGGIAAQQADTAAAGIAKLAGAPVELEPFRPVLRGLLMTGMAPRYLRGEPGGKSSAIDTEALWWPAAKIVGKHLAPFLATKLGLSESEGAAPGGPPGERPRGRDASPHGAAAG
ncbi:MAG TPA: FAD-dependent oxidoreductase [Gaiellaceae bacterium]|nr:FAD-dependent oxidoreductase [Gaiellaceae bacterium]